VVIGLIAGSKSLPFMFAREARRRGETLVAVAFEGETDPALASLVDHIEWLRVGQLTKMIAAFTDRGVRQCVMLGQIAPRNLFDLRPDLRAMGLLLRLKEKNAHTVFGAIADELARDGVQLVDPLPWLTPWMPGPGYRVGPEPSEDTQSDVEFGLRIAKEVSRLEIGQSVVVKGGTTLAVEGFEGTDACLERGGKLAGKDGGAVAVKVAKDGHDVRFDLPCLGPKTLEVCAANGIHALAFEAGRTVLIDQDELERLAARRKITLMSTALVEAVRPEG
jgi:UDP-2,3-diacylglucosamine hydrolase